MKYNFLIALFSILLLNSILIDAFAQKSKSKSKSGEKIPKSALKYYQEAVNLKGLGKHIESVPLFEKAVSKYPNYRQAYGHLNEIYWITKEYDKAEACFEKLLKLSNSPVNKLVVHYKWAQLLEDQGKYTEAIEHYNESLAVDVPAKWAPKKLEVEKWLENAKFAENAVKNPVAFKPIRMSDAVNTKHDEYLPMITADEGKMVFTRRFLSDYNPNEDFYISEFEDSTWQLAKGLLKPINTEDNEGAICIAPDGARMFFAAKGRKDSEGGFDLYYCVRNGDDWTGPYNLGLPVNSIKWDSQPSISADGKSLYFSSRRKEGHGGTDIYVSYLTDKNYWTAPENLGSKINTTENEQTPFIHPDNNTLYFSSNGHLGLGDSDIYFVRKDSLGYWGEPQNIGYPINTPGNESGLVVTADGRKAYYAAYTDSTGLDLFHFDLPKSAQPRFVNYVKGRVYDAKTEKPISASIELIDLATGELVHKTISDPVSGEFLVTLTAGKDYMYNVDKTEYLFFSENFELANKPSPEPFKVDIPLSKLSKSDDKEEYKWNAGEKVILKNVFFETNSYNLDGKSYPELDKLVDLLDEYNTLKVEISGHTDNTGKDQYNIELSKNRAKAVYQYLISKGIPQVRLSYKGYGSAEPIASNDTEEGRRSNRRTEVTILGD